jgi:hypothetical protein
MGTIAFLFIGLVLGAAVFLILFVKGHLDGLLNLRPQPQIQSSEIVDSYVNIKVRNQAVDPEQVLYDEYRTLIDSLKFSREYNKEKTKLREAYDAALNELRSQRDREKKDADTAKTVAITAAEQEYLNAQKVKARVKAEADNEWSNFGTERDRERTKARNEYDKKCAEIDKLHEKRRADYYKKKQDADNAYSKCQEVYYREKQKAQDLASNTKSKSDNAYYAKQKAEESTYQSAVAVINAAKKKETVELLTEEQHIKFKKFI